MISTKIYTTLKLEKVVAEFISKNENENKNEYLGDWNSTLFYVTNKKCWLIINKSTKYALILANIKKADLKNISSIFRKTFYEQLIYDGIEADYTLIEKIIGEINLCKTDNDKSTIGTMNSILPYFKYWKCDFKNFENMPFRELNGRINRLPNKQLGWSFPRKKMSEMIRAYAQNNM